MSYVLSVNPKAKAELLAQPEPLRTFIQASLESLAASPTSFPRAGNSNRAGQRVEFRFEPDSTVCMLLTVTFMYGADERTLYIESIQVEFGG